MSAVALGVHMVELDIRLSKDGVAMVFHDSTLDRRTNSRGRVQDFNASELQQIRLRGLDSAQMSEERIPSLDEVLKLLPQNLWINIHIKGSQFDSRGGWWRRWFAGQKKLMPGSVVAQVVATTGRQHQTFLACGPENAAAAREVLPEILLCHNRRANVGNPDFVNEAIRAGARFVQFGEHRPYTAEIIAQLEAEGVWATYACANSVESTRLLLADGIRFPLANGIRAIAPHFTELGVPPLSSPPEPTDSHR